MWNFGRVWAPMRIRLPLSGRRAAKDASPPRSGLVRTTALLAILSLQLQVYGPWVLCEQNNPIIHAIRCCLHRSGLYCGEKAVIAHERLAIVDPESGDQPLYARDDDSLVRKTGLMSNKFQRYRFIH